MTPRLAWSGRIAPSRWIIGNRRAYAHHHTHTHVLVEVVRRSPHEKDTFYLIDEQPAGRPGPRFERFGAR